jgi:dUTP pyrophosphatase
MIRIRRRLQSAKYPSRNYKNDAGFDLPCCKTKILWPFQCIDLDTGWDIKIPDGFFGMIKTRSSTFFRRKILVLEGVIDPDYTGPLSVVIFNPTLIPKIVKKGERLGQLVILPLHYFPMAQVNELPLTGRGNRGFGHTGM